MKGFRGVLISGIAIWVGAVLQQSLSSRIGIFGARPDFLLIILSCLSLYASRVGGAFIGFFTGLATGAITGSNMSQYIFSRTLTGFLDAWSRNLGFDPNAIVAAANAFAVTIFAQLILMFFAPPPGIAAFLGATIASAMVNGVLAVPVHALLRRILGPQGA
jgi:rod shape-determining protein MreD